MILSSCFFGLGLIVSDFSPAPAAHHGFPWTAKARVSFQFECVEVVPPILAGEAEDQGVDIPFVSIDPRFSEAVPPDSVGVTEDDVDHAAVRAPSLLEAAEVHVGFVDPAVIRGDEPTGGVGIIGEAEPKFIQRPLGVPGFPHGLVFLPLGDEARGADHLIQVPHFGEMGASGRHDDGAIAFW